MDTPTPTPPVPVEQVGGHLALLANEAYALRDALAEVALYLDRLAGVGETLNRDLIGDL